MAGRTFEVDAEIDPGDIADVRVTYEIHPSKSEAHAWLDGHVADVQFNALEQKVILHGELGNPSQSSSARVQGIAVALVAEDGQVYAYGTGDAVVDDLAPGAVTFFEVEVHGALPVENGYFDLPGDLVVLSWASGISDGLGSPLAYRSNGAEADIVSTPPATVFVQPVLTPVPPGPPSTATPPPLPQYSAPWEYWVNGACQTFSTAEDAVEMRERLMESAYESYNILVKAAASAEDEGFVYLSDFQLGLRLAFERQGGIEPAGVAC